MKGYEKLEAALDKIEAMFKDDNFKGRFDMADFGVHDGDHAPEEQNYCGTAACMAGWLVMVDPGYKEYAKAYWRGSRIDADKGFASSAEEYYGTRHGEMGELFYTGCSLYGREGLDLKMAQARHIVAMARENDHG